MRGLVWKFSNTGDLVLNAFARRFIHRTAKPCLFLNNHRRFLGCEKDNGGVEKSSAGLVEVYACQLLNH